MQPAKKTVPEPSVPLIQGSSPKWSAALAARSRALHPQAPGFSSRLTRQSLGQSSQERKSKSIINYTSFLLPSQSLKLLFSETMRLKTKFSGVESLESTQKKPFRTNW